MIWEGKKGEPSKPVMPLDLNVRPILDGNYIIPKTVEYIKRNAAAKKPFFVYVGYSEVHPPVIGNPDFVGKSNKRGGLFADIIAEMDYRVGQILDAVKEAGVDDNTIVILSSDNASGGAVPQVGARLQRAVARRFSEYAVRGKHEGAGHNPVAGYDPRRGRHK
jgi:arylsulfatase A-like enzyme